MATVASHAGGIAVTAFIIAVAISLGYYQFVFIPEAGRTPVVPQEILEPEETIEVLIADGSANPENDRFFVPSDVRATLEISNLVIWTNEDPVPHTVTTDDGYEDPYSGPFDSQARPQEEGGAFVMPGEQYEFLFTETGEFPYHCVPHPWMNGIVQVVESFA